MALVFGYFNSINGDRKYNAETMSKYYSGILSRGVLQNYLDVFQVVANSAMTVTVKTGRVYFSDGIWAENISAMNLTLDQADVSLSRIDRIVVRKDKSTPVRGCAIVLKKGMPSTSPTAPALENTDLVEELCLASIYVANLSEVITQANITDERPNNSVCGFVHGLIEQIDTETLFTQYNQIFNDWFQNIKNEVASTTLIRQYTSSYTTLEDGETEIPIGISQYNAGLDILNVFVNGLKLIRDVDFTQVPNDSEKITLTKPLSAAQPIEFEVFKSIDGSDAESVVQQVYELQQSVNQYETYIYRATGVDDNIKLSHVCQERLSNMETPGQFKIEVIGAHFAATQPVSGDGTAENRYVWFDVGASAETDKKIILDFANCEQISLTTTLGNNSIFSGAALEIRNLMMLVNTGTTAIFLESGQADVKNCRVTMHGSGEQCFAKGSGCFANNTVTVSSVNAPAYCYCVTSGCRMTVWGGSAAAYTIGTAEPSVVASACYVPAGQTGCALVMTNVSCPIAAKEGYKQSYTVCAQSGYYALTGNLLGAPAELSSDASGNETGTIAASFI